MIFIIKILVLKIYTLCQFLQHFTQALLYKSASGSFPLLHFGFVIFWPKNIGKKSAREMLMKLIPYVFLAMP